MQLELVRQTKALNSQMEQNQDLKDLYDQSQLEARDAHRMVEVVLKFSNKVQRNTAVLSLQESLDERDSRISDLEKKLEHAQEQITALVAGSSQPSDPLKSSSSAIDNLSYVSGPSPCPSIREQYIVDSNPSPWL